MDLQIAGLVLSGSVYLVAVVWLWRGLGQTPIVLAEDRSSVSIVVAARNEQAQLPGCLAALAVQDYPGVFEVVVVDDLDSLGRLNL